VKVTNGEQRIFQVIEQTEAEHQIEFAQLEGGAFLDVGLSKGNMREALARFRHIFGAAFNSADVETAFQQCL
jgi:2-polyprenyl-3-methyl-5-hydroxy-6-metoxy-1,4-benzoquinol methylase